MRWRGETRRGSHRVPRHLAPQPTPLGHRHAGPRRLGPRDSEMSMQWAGTGQVEKVGSQRPQAVRFPHWARRGPTLSRFFLDCLRMPLHSLLRQRDVRDALMLTRVAQLWWVPLVIGALMVPGPGGPLARPTD